jgi:hypothetical protein
MHPHSVHHSDLRFPEPALFSIHLGIRKYPYLVGYNGNPESVEAEELISKVPADATTAYCHLKFPAIREDTLSWEQPILDPYAGNMVDFYGPCDYNPVGTDEIRAQRRVLLRGNYEDGD